MHGSAQASLAALDLHPRRWRRAAGLAVLCHIAAALIRTGMAEVPDEARLRPLIITMPVSFQPQAPAVPTQTARARPSHAPRPEAPPVQKAAPPKSDPQPEPEAKPKLPEQGLKLLPLPPLPGRPMTAFDQAPDEKKAPANPKYLSSTNGQAADRGPKDKPKGDPYQAKGESKEIRYVQRRGETDAPLVTRDPRSGSIKKEGQPDAGAPPESGEGQAQKPLAGTRPQPKPEAAPPPAAAANLPDRQTPAHEAASTPSPLPGDPLAASRAKEQEPQTQKTSAGEDAGTATVNRSDEAGLLAAVPERLQALKGAGAQERERARRARLERRFAQGKRERPAPRATTPAALPKPPQRKAEQEEDELAELKRRLEGLEHRRPAPKSTRKKVGAPGREGQIGHAGDGTLRHGASRAVSDVVTVNLDTAAAKTGEVAFSKIKDDRLAYLRPFFRRVDAKWKADLYARARSRLEIGTVVMRVVIRRDGKLLEASELKRSEDISDASVAVCKQGLQDAAPLRPFPEKLSASETLSCTVQFLYR